MLCNVREYARKIYSKAVSLKSEYCPTIRPILVNTTFIFADDDEDTDELTRRDGVKVEGRVHDLFVRLVVRCESCSYAVLTSF